VGCTGTKCGFDFFFSGDTAKIELVSKELNYLAAHFATLCREFVFYEVKEKKKYYYFSKRKRKYFYTFNHFYSEVHIFKKSKNSKIIQICYYDPQSAGINVQSPQSESTLRRLTLCQDPKRGEFRYDSERNQKKRIEFCCLFFALVIKK
jgi:hypothetical protein